MSAITGQFAQFCRACSSDVFMLMAVVTNATILGVMAAMLWAMMLLPR